MNRFSPTFIAYLLFQVINIPILKDLGKNNHAILTCNKRAHKYTHYLSPEVLWTFIEDPQGYCGTERRCWARGLTIWKGRCQRLCRHGKKATGVAGRGGSGYRGVDRGRGHQRTPKTWRHKVKKSLESNKPSAPPLCQGPSGTDLKDEEGGGEFIEDSNSAFPEKDPSCRTIMGKKNKTLHWLLFFWCL